MLARSILKSIESKTYEALINNKERNHRELKERIRMMSSQRYDTEKNNLTKKGKKQTLMKLLNEMNLLITI